MEEYINVQVLGPCPGCDAWQIDYTFAVARSAEDAIDIVNTVEWACEQHALHECPGLLSVVVAQWASAES